LSRQILQQDKNLLTIKSLVPSSQARQGERSSSKISLEFDSPASPLFPILKNLERMLALIFQPIWKLG